jgi:hypothetical protein
MGYLFFFYILSCLLLVVFGAGVYALLTLFFKRHFPANYNKKGLVTLAILMVSFFTSLSKVIFTLIVRKELKKSNNEFHNSIDAMGMIDSPDS